MNPLAANHMQSIGERLEEARKRRGISIREASEATKIRGDFLLSFENNQFDIGLPEIYVRGFIRNYASFLKIDAEKIITDLAAALVANAKSARKESREFFGRMEIPERPRSTGERTSGEGQSSRRAEESAARPAISPELGNHLKIAGIIAAGIIVVLIIIWLMKEIISGVTTPDIGAPAPAEVLETAAQETITLIALDAVNVRVTRMSDDGEIFAGTLARGETRDVQIQGRVWVYYSDGPNLNLGWKGQRYRMTAAYGRSQFPP